MISLIGRATTSDQRSENAAARVFGVISPNITMTTVINSGATRSSAPWFPKMSIAIAVPIDEAKIMNAFSVSRMVAKNFSCWSRTRFMARADLLPCSARYRIRNLFTEIRLASTLLKKATNPMQATRMIDKIYRLEIPNSMARPDLPMPTQVLPGQLSQISVSPHMPSIHRPFGRHMR